jgi:ABC-type sugar transport system permease subunit
LIYLFNAGGPPMANAPTPAGHTDILISYVYNLAFAGTRGVNYGFASAITIVIFSIVAVITLFQFRYTRMWEEVGENV